MLKLCKSRKLLLEEKMVIYKTLIIIQLTFKPLTLFAIGRPRQILSFVVEASEVFKEFLKFIKVFVFRG